NENKNNFVLIQDEQEKTTNDTPYKNIEGGFSFSSFSNFNEEIKNLNVEIPKYKEENFSILKTPDTLKAENNISFENKLQITNEHEKLSIIDMNKNLFENSDFKEKYEQQKVEEDFSYKLIGSIFNTYILIEREDNIYLLDQHAGHERLLYDKFIQQFNDKKLISQPLLIPYIFNVNEIENDLIENNTEIFTNFGFEIENFGNLTYKINSIPNILNGLDLESFIFDILSNTTKVSNTSEEIKNFFAKKACKAAVKGGQNLSKEEINILIKDIFSKKTTLLCPHGRPICIKLTKYEIEKMFKRIV
ncbi:MAG: hypothetical protein IKA31_04840, partial [Clostridia bacterium]|nr:hypothetical protein [Clostridia bacterium]